MPEETSVKFAKFLRTPFLQSNSGRLLLKCGHCNNEPEDRLYTLILCKNIVYKNIQAQIGQKIKNILKISSASVVANVFFFFSKIFLINRTK